MEKKEVLNCDFTTGICGAAEPNNGIIDFTSFTPNEEEKEVEIEEDVQ